MPRRHFWKKGEGEFVGFAIGLVTMMSVFFIMVGCLMLHRNVQAMEDATQIICRDLVVCESKKEAQKLATEEAKKYFKSYKSISHAVATVTYSANSEAAWKKGNFIVLTIGADIKTIDPFTSGRRSTSVEMMIERDGD